MTKHTTPDHSRLDRVVAEARQQRDQRETGYRERALKLFPHICGRCGREFAGDRLRELTVHHKDHNHDNNPNDGSNWELLCLYCHDNEHSRVLDEAVRNRGADGHATATHNPFAALQPLLKKN
jgi:5-methylcytosine-specific restriction endonuclease McrA